MATIVHRREKKFEPVVIEITTLRDLEIFRQIHGDVCSGALSDSLIGDGHDELSEEERTAHYNLFCEIDEIYKGEGSYDHE